MVLKRFTQLVMGLFLIGLLSACMGHGTQPSNALGGCKWNKESCMYEGAYEPGEREYAEAEAKDLNREAARKVRRRTGWW